MKKIIDLGWANGWHGTPDVIKQAEKKGFKIEEVRHDCRQCVTWY